MATLAQRLQQQGVHTMLVATHGPTESALIKETHSTGVSMFNLSMKNPVDPAGPMRLFRMLLSWRPQIIHTRTIRADLVGRVGASLRIPVINNIVNMYPDDCLVRLGPVLGRAEMTLFRSTKGAARLFVANSEAVAANTASAFGLPFHRIEVVYDGLLLDRWWNAAPADLTSSGITSAHRVCLSVARLHPQKGLDDLITAARYVHSRHPDVRFVVAGDGPMRAELEGRVRGEQLEKVIVFLGQRDDIPNLLARAELFVLPSRFEGLPSAIIEAMAAGRPVVATSTAGVPELIDDGSTGWLVPPGAPDRLAEALAEALSAELIEVGTAARRRAESLFSADGMTAGFSDVYDSLALR
jgi:glycosyltransferase involved in cell wall biosynthesis